MTERLPEWVEMALEIAQEISESTQKEEVQDMTPVEDRKETMIFVPEEISEPENLKPVDVTPTDPRFTELFTSMSDLRSNGLEILLALLDEPGNPTEVGTGFALMMERNYIASEVGIPLNREADYDVAFRVISSRGVSDETFFESFSEALGTRLVYETEDQWGRKVKRAQYPPVVMDAMIHRRHRLPMLQDVIGPRVGDWAVVEVANPLLAYLFSSPDVNPSEQVRSLPGLATFWSDDRKTTMLFFLDHSDLEFSESMELGGVRIRGGRKFAKRAKEFAREARWYGHRKIYGSDGEPHPFTTGVNVVAGIRFGVFESPEEEVPFYDGQFLVTRDFVSKMMRRDASKGRLAKVVSTNMRVSGPFGLIKGDALIVDGPLVTSEGEEVDVLLHSENVKTEFALLRDMVMTFEAHHDHSMVRTDSLTMSWMGGTLWERDQLIDWFRKTGNHLLWDIQQGRYPQLLEVDTTDDQDDDDMGYEDFSALYKSSYDRWQAYGRDLAESAHFIYSMKNAFLARYGDRLRLPVYHALRAYVTTHELLKLAGFGDDVEGREDLVFYHGPTKRLSFPGHVFSALYENHGGWDLDDSVALVKVFFADGTVKGVTFRVPNAFGEWGLIDVDWDVTDEHLYVLSVPEDFEETEGGKFMATDFVSEPYRFDGTVSDLLERLPQIQEVAKQVTYRGLPEPAPVVDHSLGTALRALRAQCVNPNVGRFVNPSIVWWASQGTFMTHQIAPTEDIVDALQQGADLEQFSVINLGIEEMTGDVLTSGPLDWYTAVYERRVPGKAIPWKEGMEPTPDKEGFFYWTKETWMSRLYSSRQEILNLLVRELGVMAANRKTIAALMPSGITSSQELSEYLDTRYSDVMPKVRLAVRQLRKLSESAPKFEKLKIAVADRETERRFRFQLMDTQSGYRRWVSGRFNNWIAKEFPTAKDQLRFVRALYLFTERNAWNLRKETARPGNRSAWKDIDSILFQHADEHGRTVMDLLAVAVSVMEEYRKS